MTESLRKKRLELFNFILDDMRAMCVSDWLKENCYPDVELLTEEEIETILNEERKIFQI